MSRPTPWLCLLVVQAVIAYLRFAAYLSAGAATLDEIKKRGLSFVVASFTEDDFRLSSSSRTVSPLWSATTT
jgi:hypothetical protein